MNRPWNAFPLSWLRDTWRRVPKLACAVAAALAIASTASAGPIVTYEFVGHPGQPAAALAQFRSPPAQQSSPWAIVSPQDILLVSLEPLYFQLVTYPPGFVPQTAPIVLTDITAVDSPVVSHGTFLVEGEFEARGSYTSTRGHTIDMFVTFNIVDTVGFIESMLVDTVTNDRATPDNLLGGWLVVPESPGPPPAQVPEPIAVALLAPAVLAMLCARFVRGRGWRLNRP